MNDYLYQFVIQIIGGLVDDYDSCMAVYYTINDTVPYPSNEIDGYDFGSGTMNIFIDTNDPKQLLADLTNKSLVISGTNIICAYKTIDDEDYTVIWPPNGSSSFEIL